MSILLRQPIDMQIFVSPFLYQICLADYFMLTSFFCLKINLNHFIIMGFYKPITMKIFTQWEMCILDSIKLKDKCKWIPFVHFKLLSSYRLNNVVVILFENNEPIFCQEVISSSDSWTIFKSLKLTTMNCYSWFRIKCILKTVMEWEKQTHLCWSPLWHCSLKFIMILKLYIRFGFPFVMCIICKCNALKMCMPMCATKSLGKLYALHADWL